MTPPSPERQKEPTVDVSARYAYHVPNPFEQPQWIYDKNGVLCFMSMNRYLEECEKPKNRFTLTTLEAVLPGVCLGLGVLTLAFIVASAI